MIAPGQAPARSQAILKTHNKTRTGCLVPVFKVFFLVVYLLKQGKEKKPKQGLIQTELALLPRTYHLETFSLPVLRLLLIPSRSSFNHLPPISYIKAWFE